MSAQKSVTKTIPITRGLSLLVEPDHCPSNLDLLTMIIKDHEETWADNEISALLGNGDGYEIAQQFIKKPETLARVQVLVGQELERRAAKKRKAVKS